MDAVDLDVPLSRDNDRRLGAERRAGVADSLAMGHTLDAIEYQKQIDVLRAAGCRCLLMWNGEFAVPLNGVTADGCPAIHRLSTE